MVRNGLLVFTAFWVLISGSPVLGAERTLSAKRLAAELKRLIGDAVYLSDEDQAWNGFFTAMDPKQVLNEENLRVALKIPLKNDLEVWSAKEIQDFWKYYIDGEPLGKTEARAYAAVKAKMEEALTDIGLYRTSRPDVAFSKIYLLGRMENGALVGLVTEGVGE